MLDLSAYVSVSQAARELSVHPETVRRLLRQDELPGSKVGTLWFIARDDLSHFKATYDPRPGPRKRVKNDHKN
jgi:excisionase family DNA binding protein